MSTAAQMKANYANAQHSTGPTSAAGKAASSQNHRIHGLSGSRFQVLAGEDQNAFDALSASLTEEHQPETPTEELLVAQMVQSAWLKDRALRMQESCFENGIVPEQRERAFALYIRYQTTHERTFHRALGDLLKLRNQSRKQEIGFESKKRQEAEEARREADENRKAEMHEFKKMLAQAKIDYEEARISNLEMDKIIAERRNSDLAEYLKETGVKAANAA